jgi:hypothetical protein
MGPMTWIGSEDRDELRTGSLEKIPPSRVQCSGSTSETESLEAECS